MASSNYILRISILFVFALPTQAISNTSLVSPQKSFGHNLAPSTETLSQYQWTVGTYYVGTGLTNDLTIGVSPWIAIGYNLENVIVKFKHKLGDDFLSHQLAYFNSNKNLGQSYIQKSMSYWLTFGYRSDNYKISTTLNYMYFWNETIPFSLRREPFNNEAQQVTLTTLHQFYFSESTILQFEVGVLGMNYTYPNISAGASWLHYFGREYSAQIGASLSKRLGNRDMTYLELDKSYIKNVENYNSDSIHPEIQIQYWF